MTIITFPLFGKQIRCAVLSTGERVVMAASVSDLLEADTVPDLDELVALMEWLSV
mgnify:CR=1 FL=1